MIVLLLIILLIFSLVFFLIWFWFFKGESEPVENFYKLALKAFESGDYKKAKDLFLQMSNLASNTDAKYKLGITCFKLKEYAEAKSYFEEVVKKNPKNTDALSKLAEILQLQGDYDEAIAIFNKIAKQDPKNPKNATNISDVYFNKGDFEKALETLENAKKDSPDDAGILFSIVKCKSQLCNIENDEECKEMLDEYIKLAEKKDLPLEFNTAIAKAYAVNGDVEKATEYCKKAISQNTEDVDAHRLLGLVQLVNMDFDGAKSNLTVALNIQPNNKETHNIFSYLFCKQVDDCPLQECREKYYKLVKKYLK